MQPCMQCITAATRCSSSERDYLWHPEGSPCTEAAWDVITCGADWTVNLKSSKMLYLILSFSLTEEMLAPIMARTFSILGDAQQSTQAMAILFRLQNFLTILLITTRLPTKHQKRTVLQSTNHLKT